MDDRMYPNVKSSILYESVWVKVLSSWTEDTGSRLLRWQNSPLHECIYKFSLLILTPMHRFQNCCTDLCSSIQCYSTNHAKPSCSIDNLYFAIWTGLRAAPLWATHVSWGSLKPTRLMVDASCQLGPQLGLQSEHPYVACLLASRLPLNMVICVRNTDVPQEWGRCPIKLYVLEVT